MKQPEKSGIIRPDAKISFQRSIDELKETIQRRTLRSSLATAYWGGKLLGRATRPLRGLLDTLVDRSRIDIDEDSINHLKNIAERGNAVIIAANHRPPVKDSDKYLDNFLFYRLGIHIDLFAIRRICERYGIPLSMLASYNRDNHHARKWRRIKEMHGNEARRGFYPQWDIIPVRFREERREDGTIASYPLNLREVDVQIREAVGKGRSVLFFVNYDDQHQEVARIPSGPSWYSQLFGIPAVPMYGVRFKHFSSIDTYQAGEGIVFRVGEEINPKEVTTSGMRVTRRQQSREIVQSLNALRKDAVEIFF